MKTAKSNKIITLIIALCFSLIMGVFTLDFGTKTVAHAQISSSEISTYFTGTTSLEYKNDNLSIKVTGDEAENNEFSFKNNLVINDFALEMKVPQDAISLKLTFTTDSYLASGNKNSVGKFDTSIKNVLDLAISGSTLKASFNGGALTDIPSYTGSVVIETEIVNNFIVVSVCDTTVASNSDDYYKVGGIDKTTANLGFEFGLADGATDKEFELVFVDQKKSDNTGAYKQTFEIEDGKLKTEALRRVTVSANNGLFNYNGEIKVRDAELKSYYISAYSVFSTSSSDLYLKAGDVNADINCVATIEEKTTKLIFNKSKNATSDYEKFIVTDGTNDVEEYSVCVLDSDYLEDTNVEAPKYTTDANKIEAYKDALYKATKIEINDKEYYVRIGDYLEIPSLIDLVEYEYLSYEALSFTVYVNTPTENNRTYTSRKIKIDAPGDYKFYVMFKDGTNSMESPIDNEDLMETSLYAFSFTIEDNAPLIVKVGSTAETGNEGYVGVRYSAVPFVIQAENYTPTYKLYYNADKNASADSEGWVEIIKKSSLTNSYENDVFTSDDITTINYDGSLDFTPIKEGAYKIECKVTSALTVSSQGDTFVIKVAELRDEVKPDSEWLKNNKVSVIFLSVGTLCLAGIIVLLFVKPKEKTSADDED